MLPFRSPTSRRPRGGDAELGRQPWLVYGLMRTAAGSSELVSGGEVFSTLGFVGLYLLLGLLFVVQVLKEIDRGPAAAHLSGFQSRG